MEFTLRRSNLRYLSVVALFCAPSFGGFIRVWTIGELATAPILAVCRIEKVAPGADLPPGKTSWATSTRNMRAVLTVIRSLPVMDQTSINLDYYGYGSTVRGLTQGDSILPAFSKGDIRALPLVRAAGQWRLALEEGRNNVMPAIAPPRPEPPARTGYDFLVGELVNSLSWGNYRDIHDTALYLREIQRAGLPEALMPLLRQNIGKDWERWADIASASLSSGGIPRKTLAEIRSIEPPSELPTLALRQLSARDYPELIIRRMISHSDVHDWGSAPTLQEFAKDPLVIKLLSDRLRTLAPGSVYIAAALIRTDPQSPLTPDALEAAFKALNSPKSTRNDRRSAPRLIVEKGSELQFNALLERFRAAQRNDTKLYAEIFDAAYDLDLPRARRIYAAMLDDRRIFSDQMRYCDIAGGRLQAFSKQNFGFKNWNQPLAEREKALESVSRWLKSHAQ